MTKYRFYLHRDVFLPGPPEEPEIQDLETEDPQKTAQGLLRGQVDRVDWDLDPLET